MSESSSAQWSIAPSISYLNLLVKDGYSNYGLSLKAEKNMLYFGLGYNGKVIGERTVLVDTTVIGSGQGYALSAYSIKSYTLFLGVKNYFVGDYDEDFGFYGLVDIAYYYLPITKRLDGPKHARRYYRHILYGTNKEPDTEFVEKSTSEVLLTGGVGLGLEKKIKGMYIYSEIKIKMSVTGTNEQPGSATGGGSSMFFPMEINLGLRIPLDYY